MCVVYIVSKHKTKFLYSYLDYISSKIFLCIYLKILGFSRPTENKNYIKATR